MNIQQNTKTVSQTLFQPDNLDWILSASYLKKTLAKYKPAKRQVLYALHRVFVAKYSHDKGRVPLSHETMTQIAKGENSHWAKVRRILAELGVLSCDYDAIKDQKSYYYWLGPAMKNVTWTKSEDPSVLTLPIRTDLSLPTIGLPRLSVDRGLLPDALSYAKAHRTHKPFTDQQAKVWEWYLEEQLAGDYMIARTGRIYGDWSRIPRELRGVLLLDGKPVVEVDIKNSQPLLLASVYSDLDAPCEEANKYISLVQSGNLYESIMDVMDCRDRELVKKEVNAWLCGRRDERAPIIFGYFQREFPTLHGLIVACKHAKREMVAYLLQGLESDVVVNSLCEEFPVLSMHDGVICHVEIAETVKARAAELIREKYGLDATIKIEDKRQAILEHSARAQGACRRAA